MTDNNLERFIAVHDIVLSLRKQRKEVEYQLSLIDRQLQDEERLSAKIFREMAETAKSPSTRS